MFDDDDGVSLVDQPVDHQQQLADVVEMQARGGLVENVDGASGGSLLQLGGQLHALGLTAGQRRGGLSESDVAQTDVDEGA